MLQMTGFSVYAPSPGRAASQAVRFQATPRTEDDWRKEKEARIQKINGELLTILDQVLPNLSEYKVTVSPYGGKRNRDVRINIFSEKKGMLCLQIACAYEDHTGLFGWGRPMVSFFSFFMSPDLALGKAAGAPELTNFDERLYHSCNYRVGRSKKGLSLQSFKQVKISWAIRMKQIFRLLANQEQRQITNHDPKTRPVEIENKLITLFLAAMEKSGQASEIKKFLALQ